MTIVIKNMIKESKYYYCYDSRTNSFPLTVSTPYFLLATPWRPFFIYDFKVKDLYYWKASSWIIESFILTQHLKSK